MCGRFQLDVSLETLEEMFESLQIPERQVLQTGELSPGRQITSIQYQDSNYVLKNGFWGKKRDKGLQINARIERWEKTYHHFNRCIIPATGYYEWNQQTKAKVLFEADANSMFFLAGVVAVDEGGRSETLIVTKDAEKEFKRIHPRMPVVFDLTGSKLFLKNQEYVPSAWKTLRQWHTKICSSEQMRLF